MNVYIDMALSRYLQSVAYFFVIFFHYAERILSLQMKDISCGRFRILEILS